MARSPIREAPPESDRFGAAPHPRNARAFMGHREQERELLEAYRGGRLAQAWIIGGPEGVGKATLAWRFSRFLLVNPDPAGAAVRDATDLSTGADHPALRRLAAMSHGDVALLRREWNEKSKRHFTEIRIDDVRKALDLFRRASGEGGWRVCLVDCAEDLNRSSANALLKLIEEPPSRSLFLLVAHRPAQILPTLRSRSRLLRLGPLSAQDVAGAIPSLGPPWSERSRADIEAAAARSGGSVRQAMRLLEGEGLKLTAQLERLLSALPRLDWRAAQSIADLVGGRDGEDSFKAFLGACYDWLDGRVHQGGPPARLVALAEAWERISAGAREVESLNLDRRPFVLGVFSHIAQAVEVSDASAR